MRVLFLCTGNSARSQLAEALLRQRTGGRVEVASAGTDTKDVHPFTVEVLADLGIHAGEVASKHLDCYLDEQWDFVITVCDRAAESCPVFPKATNKMHWSFSDPAAADDSLEGQRIAFESVRDAIDERVSAFATHLELETGNYVDGGD